MVSWPRLTYPLLSQSFCAPRDLHLSLHDALPIYVLPSPGVLRTWISPPRRLASSRLIASPRPVPPKDRKSTRLNSSHLGISYAVFCLKKKNKLDQGTRTDPQRHTRRPHRDPPHVR